MYKTPPDIADAPVVSASSARVAILMGTYQGERFLDEQLDSIENQTWPDWRLWVSDDHSTDSTVDLLKLRQKNWGRHRLEIVTGPGMGFAANFISLACRSDIDAEYFAFCDQDDVWHPDKLERALTWLRSLPETVPALYCGRTKLIDEEGCELGFSPLFMKPPGFANALVQSLAGGNTMLFNRAARALICEAGMVDVQTHDWWLYIVTTCCGGRVFYDATPSVCYRQHGKNLVGSNAGWRPRWRRARRLLEGRFKSMNDRNIAALHGLRHRLSEHSAFVLDTFGRARKMPMMGRIMGIFRSGVFHQTRLGTVGLAVAVLTNKL